MSYHIITYRTISYHISCHIISYYTISCYIVSYRITPHHQSFFEDLPICGQCRMFQALLPMFQLGCRCVFWGLEFCNSCSVSSATHRLPTALLMLCQLFHCHWCLISYVNLRCSWVWLDHFINPRFMDSNMSYVR